MEKPTYCIQEYMQPIINQELYSILIAKDILSNLNGTREGVIMEPVDALFGIEPIFNMHKIRFDTLNSWNLLRGYSTANIYINLDNVIKIILNERTNNAIHAAINALDDGEKYLKDLSLGLISNIINLGQHYRLWLAKNGVDSRVVLFWGYPLPDQYKNSSYIPAYRMSYRNQFTNTLKVKFVVDALNDATTFLKTCIQYVNEVYLISAGEVEPSIVPYVIQENGFSQEGTLNLLVSNDIYDYAYVNYGFTVLSPSSGRKSEPKLLTKETLMDVLKRKYKIQRVFYVPEILMEYINAILGSELRNIQRIDRMTFSKLVQGIDVGLAGGHFTDTTKDVHMLAECIAEEFRDIFIANYLSTNIRYQVDALEPLDVHRIMSQIVDKYDETTLNNMNERYFKRFPIDIVNPKSTQVLYKSAFGRSIFDKS